MIGAPPRARAVLLDLKADQPLGAGHAGREWADQARKDGALIFADVGWDHTGKWPTHVVDQLEHCHAFMPNAAEAMSYTRTQTAQDALFALADRVPLAVVGDRGHALAFGPRRRRATRRRSPRRFSVRRS